MESIVQPISDTSTCGEYLKGNKTLYRALRNSFNQAQSSYRQLMESPDAASDDELVEQNIENWRALGDVCKACLTDDAKDIEVFGWYISAQLFGANALSNLQLAFEDFAQVIDAYWSDLHPKPPVDKLKSVDDSGRDSEWAGFKIKPMWQLAGESESSGILAMPLLNLPLVGTINYTQFYSAERAGSLADLKEGARQFFSADKEQITQRILALAAIEISIKGIEITVNKNCAQVSAKGISFKFLLKLVSDLLNAVKYLVGDAFTVWPLDVTKELETIESDPIVEQTSVKDDDGSVVSAVVTQNVSSAQRVAISAGEALFNRDQAFTELRKISEYFQRTEPHSPVHMLLERAIRWGYMSLPDLLDEMVGENDQVMGRISQMAGLESVVKTVVPTPSVSAAEFAQHKSSANSSISAPQVEVAAVKKVAAVENVKEETKEEKTESSKSGISSFQW